MATSGASSISHQPILRLEGASPSDLPSMRKVFYTSFSSPRVLRMFPDTPSAHQWWDAANLHSVLHKPYDKYLVIKDHSTIGNGKVVGYVKWIIPIGDEITNMKEISPRWSTEGDPHFADEFFGALASERKLVMGDRQYYFIDKLCALPEYRRQGAATMLIEWGTERADRDGLECFVNSSDMAASVYQRA